MSDVLDLDARRRDGPVLIEAELVAQEYQVRLKLEQLQTRIQTAQMWNDDNQSWVEEEQLRLDGVESWLLDTLAWMEEELPPYGVNKSWVLDQMARLEERQALVDLAEAQLEFSQSHLDRVQQSFEHLRTEGSAGW